MLILTPFSAPRIWGTERLREYGADKSTTGSVYSVAGTDQLDVVAIDTVNGDQSSLKTIVQSNPERFGLLPGEEYPIIVDMLGADADLSIQVHPTDQFARSQGLNYGKSESWVFLTAPTSGTVYSGLRNPQYKVQPDEFRSHPLTIVDEQPVEIGDYAFVPSGTVHAIRAGSLVYEIQQSTDITYRLYDYNRPGLNGQPRALDVEDALQNVVTTSKVQIQHWGATASVTEAAYHLSKLTISGKYDYVAPAGVATSVTVVAGAITVGDHTIHQGGSIIVPPGERTAIQGSATIIAATPRAYWREHTETISI